MRARRTAWLLGPGWVLAFASLSFAVADEVGLPPPEAPPAAAIGLPAPVAAPADPFGLRAAFDQIARPDLPAVLDIRPVEPLRTGSILPPPEPPAAVVIVTAAERLAGAIELRLTDPKLPLSPRLSRRDRDALSAFYAGARYRPLWVDEGGWNAKGRALAGVLARAGEDGLEPNDYLAPALDGGSRRDALAELAEAELKMSALAFLYARDARGGRIDPSRLSALLTPKLELPSLDGVLAAVSSGGDVDAALAGYQPAYPGYRALRDKLAQLRANRPAIAGAVTPRSRPVRTTIAVLGEIDVEASAIPSMTNPRLEADIVANMERWRWLPAAVAPRYVAVNVPEFRLRLMEEGRVAHETRVITGKPETPTPIFSGVMDQAVVNPSWHIPPSIMKNEILPGLARDPDYAAKRGYEVVRRGGAVSVRQPPGERNALGFIKFLFPNNHAVYLHDTPNRSLFSSARRAFSHGCVRVENPFRLADFVLGAEWSEDRLKRLIGRGERTIRLPASLPVHLTYFTVAVDEYGSVRTFEDLYGHHRRVRAALGLGA